MDVAGLAFTMVLVLVTGFFVAAEYALVRVRETQLAARAEKGSATARLAHRMVRGLDQYISATQVGITAASVGLGIVGEPAVFGLVRGILPSDGSSTGLFHALAFAIAFLVVTFVTIVVGELAPKYVALHAPVRVALATAVPLFSFTQVVRPFIWAVAGGARLVLRIFGLGKPPSDAAAYSEEELRLMVAAWRRSGILQESEQEILLNVLEFADKAVRQVMVPRTEVVAIEAEATARDLVDLASRQPFTRYPVYREDIDHVLGLVHLRDVVGLSPEELRARRMTQLMRPVVTVPESMRLDRALAEMRRQRLQVLLVVDEFGGTAGLVAMEDLLEELVGELRDEFDRAAPRIRSSPDGWLVIDGLVPLGEARERLALDLEGEPYDTVGGLVFGRLGRVGRPGDSVEVEGVRFEVTAMDGKRIAQVRARRVAPSPA